MDTLATKLSIHGMRLEYMYSYLEPANISFIAFTTATFLWLSFIPPPFYALMITCGYATFGVLFFFYDVFKRYCHHPDS